MPRRQQNALAKRSTCCRRVMSPPRLALKHKRLQPNASSKRTQLRPWIAVLPKLLGGQCGCATDDRKQKPRRDFKGKGSFEGTHYEGGRQRGCSVIVFIAHHALSVKHASRQDGVRCHRLVYCVTRHQEEREKTIGNRIPGGHSRGSEGDVCQNHPANLQPVCYAPRRTSVERRLVG